MLFHFMVCREAKAVEDEDLSEAVEEDPKEEVVEEEMMQDKEEEDSFLEDDYEEESIGNEYEDEMKVEEDEDEDEDEDDEEEFDEEDDDEEEDDDVLVGERNKNTGLVEESEDEMPLLGEEGESPTTFLSEGGSGSEEGSGSDITDQLVGPFGGEVGSGDSLNGDPSPGVWRTCCGISIRRV